MMKLLCGCMLGPTYTESCIIDEKQMDFMGTSQGNKYG